MSSESSTQKLTIANWNVFRPVKLERRERIRKCLEAVTPDLLVLTETHTGFELPFKYSIITDCQDDRNEKLEEHRWAAIHSNEKMERLETTDTLRTVAARVMPVNANPYVVFATVLPWRGSTWKGLPYAEGKAFAASLDAQLSDWKHLRSTYPMDDFFVIGDFNQDLVGSKYYGSKRNRDHLKRALESVGLIALTGGDNDPVARDSKPCACIDHICMNQDSVSWKFVSSARWPATAKPDKSLSDHFGIVVTLARLNR